MGNQQFNKKRCSSKDQKQDYRSVTSNKLDWCFGVFFHFEKPGLKNGGLARSTWLLIEGYEFHIIYYCN